jgi:hypothetical protein
MHKDKTKISKVILASLLIGVSACSTAQNLKTTLSLENVRKLSLGKSTREQIIQSMGYPPHIFPIVENQENVLWYTASHGNDAKLTLYVDRKTGILNSISWGVYHDEWESNIKHAKSLFKNSTFKHYYFPNTGTDVFSNLEYFIDQEAGIVITCDRTPDNVVGIEWKRPNDVAKWIAESESRQDRQAAQQ